MKTIFYVLSLFAVVASLACAAWRKWGPATFWMATAIWLISGCAMIDYSRTVPGWPVMQTTETKVTTAEATRRCRATQENRCSGTSRMSNITSYYQWNFDTKHDWIWYGQDSDLEHERAHHSGHPHIGENANSAMQCYLDEWRSNQERDL